MMFRVIWFLFVTPWIYSLQIPLLSEFNEDPNPLLPSEWEALGPFPFDVREMGFDSLSAYGGFEALPYSETDKYPSELANGGFVGWKKFSKNGEGAVGPISYPEIRWDFNQKPFGWSILQHIVYLRGTITISESAFYVVSFANVMSFKIDNQAYGGNLRGNQFPAPSIIYLRTGEHKIYTTAIMDVRANGGSIPPQLSFKGRIQKMDDLAPQHGVLLFPEVDIMPEVMDGKLATPYAAITLLNGRFQNPLSDLQNVSKRNTFYSFSQDLGWLRLTNVYAKTETGEIVNTTDPISYSIKIAPGQMMSIPIEILPRKDDTKPLQSLHFFIEFTEIVTREKFTVQSDPHSLKRRVWNDIYKMTFIDYDKSVQFALIRPPKNVSCVRSDKVGCPIVVALHGAGVEVESEFWLNAYRQQNYAWILYASGRTAWGHDWHGASNLNCQMALEALAAMPGVPEEYKKGLRPDTDRLVMTGHSNGGQGAWWMASHFPDKMIAALPASGYMSVHAYVPFYLRSGYSYADPTLRAILESSISEHDVDLYASNLEGIPIFPRTGADDDNVPPWHTRRLVRLVNEWSRNPHSLDISELAGKGHWFDGVLSDDETQKFLDRYLDREINPTLLKPPFPDAFTITTMNPFSTGSKGGIRILQAQVPFRLATLRVRRKGDQWIMDTTNVRRLGFVYDERQEGISSFSLDGKLFGIPPSNAGPSYLRNSMVDPWEAAPDLLWISKERHPGTYGPVIHVLNHPFLIIVPSHTHLNITYYNHLAQQIAMAWYSCCRGNTQIIKDVELLDGLAAQYNVIVLGGPIDNLYTRRREGEGVSTMMKYLPSGGVQLDNHKYEEPGTGVLFLAPSPTRTRSAVYVTGVDLDGLSRAAWSLPFRTGVMIPDYFIVGKEFGDPTTGWTAGDGAPLGGAGTKGVGGVLAAGYWNNTWDYDPRCGYLK